MVDASPPSQPTPFPPPPSSATFPVPPQPTAGVELVLPAPLPTPGGMVTAYPSLNGITDLAFAPDGALWASTYEGLVRWDLVDDSYQTMSQADGLPAPGVLSLAFAPDGSLWAGTQSGVTHFDGVKWSTVQLVRGQADDLVYGMAIALDGTIRVSHNPVLGGGWVRVFDGQTWRSITDALSVGVVTSLVATADGSVWAGSGAGVARLAGLGGLRLYTTADGLPPDGVVDLAVAPDSTLWAATPTAMVRLDGDRWTSYALSVPDAQIQAIAPGALTIWLGPPARRILTHAVVS